ncbi:hypothetical protein A0J61_04231 [Choanephora cucurbitarum]|uniref:Uncharacterized protein n=1 Tax=Choanephora cucurbitarum TaxID=101091 RepID=A0A1C7NF53_9FUNG|nr:hypothetical protein A0J61_04231 [Choanephora cucurbitarum]
MGLLKLGSIYKKKSKKDPVVEQPALPSIPPPKIEPLTLELNLDSTNAITTPLKPLEKNNTPAPVAGGLFDDIFSELDTSHPKLNKADPLHTDFSLALALSQQLQLDEDKKPAMKPLPKQEKKTTTVEPTNSLLGGDSIYSSYLRAMDTSNDSSFASSSMFDSLMKKHVMHDHKPSAPTPIPPTTQVVLDSDVSDSDEGSKNSEGEEESDEGGQQRMTKGVQPIMGRRAQDNRLLVQRKIDSWTKQVDPEAKIVETNAAMINRMKDRHRNQVKLAAMRQQFPEYNNNLMGHPHLVPQAYGVPLGQNNMVLPHPSMYMDPAHASMYYQSTEYPSTDMPQQYTNAPMTSGPTVPVRASFMPNPPPQSHMEPVKQPQFVMAKSMSTPTMPRHRKVKEMSNNSQSSVTPSSVSSSAQVNELPADSGTDIEEDKEATSSDVSLGMDDRPSPTEDDLAAQEADAESSDDEESRSVKARKQKSLRKLRQKTADVESLAIGEEGDTRTNYRQVRSSRSAPNLKKKKSSSKKSYKSSNTSSRRNSQDYATVTSTPPSEAVKTPPPMPTIPTLNEEDQHTGLRSNTAQQHAYRGAVKHMKSDPDLHKRNTQYPYQQQQHLNQEWERMQIHQREQQLKSQYQNKFVHTQQQQQQGPYMAMYPPMYYPNIPGRMVPYSSPNGPSDNNAGHYVNPDPRASYMNPNGQMAYQQPLYYHPAPR